MTSISNPSMMNRLTSKTIGKTRKSRENFSSCLFYGTRNGQKLVHTHTQSPAGLPDPQPTHSRLCVTFLSLSLPLSCVCVFCPFQWQPDRDPFHNTKAVSSSSFFGVVSSSFFLVVVVVPPSRGRLYSIFAAL